MNGLQAGNQVSDTRGPTIPMFLDANSFLTIRFFSLKYLND